MIILATKFGGFLLFKGFVLFGNTAVFDIVGDFTVLPQGKPNEWRYERKFSIKQPYEAQRPVP